MKLWLARLDVGAEKSLEGSKKRIYGCLEALEAAGMISDYRIQYLSEDMEISLSWRRWKNPTVEGAVGSWISECIRIDIRNLVRPMMTVMEVMDS